MMKDLPYSLIILAGVTHHPSVQVSQVSQVRIVDRGKKENKLSVMTGHPNNLFSNTGNTILICALYVYGNNKKMFA